MGSKTQRTESKLEATRITAFAHICTHEAPISLIAWIAFQLLDALRDVRNRKLSHGDMMSENILVKLWN